MDPSIIPRGMIEEKAREEFARGVARDDHGFNWGSPAIEAWTEEWDRCAAEAEADQVEVSPP